MDCPNCQNTIPDTAQFCAYCGATVTPAATAPPQAPATTAPGSGSSRKWLFIGGAIVAVAAVVVVAFLVMERGNGSEQPYVIPPAPALAQQPAVAPPTAESAQQPASIPPTAASAQQQPTSAPPVASAPGDVIAFSDLDWTSARIQTRIAQYIVEHGYGYTTSAVPGGTDHLFQSLRDGNSQISMEIWLPLQENGWNQARAEGKVEYIGASMDRDWQSTFVIPSYLQEEYPGLDHVDDLKDPRYRELFATASSDGKARLFSCAVGWACQEINDAQIDGYDLTGHLQVVRPDSEQALFDGLYRAYAKREPWVGYMWGTADPAILLDLVLLEEMPYSDECWFTNKACAFEDTTILIAVHSDLPSRTPEIYDFLTKWNFTTADYKGVLQWMEDNGATVEQAALNWLKEEGNSWMPWVTEKARTGVQAALTAGVDAKGWPGQ